MKNHSKNQGSRSTESERARSEKERSASTGADSMGRSASQDQRFAIKQGADRRGKDDSQRSSTLPKGS